MEFKTGENNYNSRRLDGYKDKSTGRSDFKKSCKTKGWNFEYFEEVFAENKYQKAANRETSIAICIKSIKRLFHFGKLKLTNCLLIYYNDCRNSKRVRNLPIIDEFIGFKFDIVYE